MNRPEARRPEPEQAGTEPDETEDNESEPATAPIDEDVAGSVNAALHDADE
jgi:hypothetical protein